MFNSILMVAATASKTPTEQFMDKLLAFGFIVLAFWAAFVFFNFGEMILTPKQGAVLNVIVSAFVSAITAIYGFLGLITDGIVTFIGLGFLFSVFLGITFKSIGGVYAESGDVWRSRDWRGKGSILTRIGILGTVVMSIISFLQYSQRH